MKKKKKNSFLSGMLLLSQALASKRLGRWLTHHKSLAIKHLPGNEELINRVFKGCVIMVMMMKIHKLAREKIFSILEFPLKNKWTTFLDKLNISNDQNLLTILLFKILVQELISKEKDYKPFWTPAFKELSEKSSLPIEIDYIDLPLNSLNPSYKKQVELSEALTMTSTLAMKKNFPKTCYQSFTSSIVDKWENVLVKLKIKKKETNKKVKQTQLMKTLIIKLYPTKTQSFILNEFIDTHRYVYNKTLEYVKNQGFEPDFQPLRNLLATERTRQNYSCIKYYEMYLNSLQYQNVSKDFIENETKDIQKEIKKLNLQKNPLIRDFELNTSNEIRSNAIKSVCDAYKSGFSNLKAGNIKYFNMNFKKKTESKKCIELATTDIKICNTGVKISPSKFPKNEELIKFHIKNHKKYKDLIIKNNCDLVKKNGEYFIHITIPCKEVDEKRDAELKICGIDLGVRKIASIYGNTEMTYITLKKDILNRLNNKIKFLKNKRLKPLLRNQRTGYKKKQFNKVEKKKKSFIDSVHWNIINHLIKTQDVIFLGDIKSHNIVKGNKNKTLNRDFNDLKFYQFKQRLLYKCISNKKKVFFINEAYTTQGCSSCGNLWSDIGSNEIYTCKNIICKKVFDRDMNSSKNICMKGLLS